MASSHRQNFSIPVFPFRPSSKIGGYGTSVKYFPDRRENLPNEATTKDKGSFGDDSIRSKRVIIILIIVLLLIAVAVVLAVVLSLMLNRKVGAVPYVESTTMSPISSWVPLVGNFTILNMNLQDVSAAGICQKVTYIITKSGQNASNCQITDLSQGSVKVRFNVDIEKQVTEDDRKALNRATASLALALTNDSAYYVDPSSITFEDRNNGGAVAKNCGKGQQCPGENIVCISVVDGYVCVCAAGYYRRDDYNGSCAKQDAPGSANEQTIAVQSTKSNFETSRPDIRTSRTDLQKTRPDSTTTVLGFQTNITDSTTSGPDLHTAILTSITSGAGLQTTISDYTTPESGLKPSTPDSTASKPGLQTTSPDSQTLKADYHTPEQVFRDSNANLQTSQPPTQNSRADPQSSMSLFKTTFAPSVSAITSNQSTINPTTACAVFCAATQKCIPSNQICDKYQDCPDDSDEINCPCDSKHYRCENGRCIYKSWLCDGIKDCPLGDDENPPQCRSCNSTEFICGRPRSCVPQSSQCDGVSDCRDSSDEGSCLKVNETSISDNFTKMSLVSVTYRGESGFQICSDNWTSTWSDSICKQMGHEKSSSTSYRNVNGSFLALNLSASSSNFIAYLQISNCTSNLAVAVSCVLSGCGRRSVQLNTIGPYILNGQRAKRGAWPWQVRHLVGVYSSSSESLFSQYSSCGGILINNRWILTAGHCNMVTSTGLGYTGQLKPSNVLVLLGTLSSSGDADSLRASVDKVFVHPSFNTTPAVDNDVGLLRLNEPVNFTDTIRPICLPTSTEDLSQYGVCVDTGFGRTIRNEQSNDLLQARMNLLSYQDCYSYIKNTFVRDQTQICVGTIPSEADINFCQGDSGGPLSCQDRFGIWKVIGINSYVLGTNDGTAVSTCYLSVVARVTQFVDWIQQTMSANSV